MDPIASAEHSYGIAEQVLAGVRPDHLDSPTPCTQWDVRAVVNHLIGGHFYFTASLSGQDIDPTQAPPDFAANDPEGTFANASKAMLETWRSPGVFERSVPMPIGDVPATMLIGMHTMDNFVHAWDIARATGQSDDLDPEFASQLLAMMRQAPVPRGEYFGPEQTAPEGTNPAGQLAAFLGRTV